MSFSNTVNAQSIVDSDGKIIPIELNQFVLGVEPYIKQYPPRFKNKEHQLEVINETKNVIQQINGIKLSDKTDILVLTNVAYLLAMAHNIDLNTASSAKQVFELAVKTEPDNVRTNYLFGMFLISTKKYHFESEKYLQKAYELGEQDALYSLGLLKIQKGKKEEGLSMLREYSQNNPGNEHVKKVIKAINEEKLQFKSSNGS